VSSFVFDMVSAFLTSFLIILVINLFGRGDENKEFKHSDTKSISKIFIGLNLNRHEESNTDKWYEEEQFGFQQIGPTSNQ
jgi:hypothetical protein